MINSDSQFYWAVDCRTRGCGVVLLLENIGPYDPIKFPMLLGDVRDFELFCPECKQNNTYAGLDVRWNNRATARTLLAKPGLSLSDRK